jgi:hypothetical protein
MISWSVNIMRQHFFLFLGARKLWTHSTSTRRAIGSICTICLYITNMYSVVSLFLLKNYVFYKVITLFCEKNLPHTLPKNRYNFRIAWHGLTNWASILYTVLIASHILLRKVSLSTRARTQSGKFTGHDSTSGSRKPYSASPSYWSLIGRLD